MTTPLSAAFEVHYLHDVPASEALRSTPSRLPPVVDVTIGAVVAGEIGSATPAP
jgi:hypothetical protein